MFERLFRLAELIIGPSQIVQSDSFEPQISLRARSRQNLTRLFERFLKLTKMKIDAGESQSGVGFAARIDRSLKKPKRTVEMIQSAIVFAQSRISKTDVAQDERFPSRILDP